MDFSSFIRRLEAVNKPPIHSQIVQFSGIDEKGMNLDYYNNSYINVDDLDFLQNNVLYITGLPASGKTELAERLSQKYDIPFISLDEIANNEFDFSNKTVEKYIQASQSDDFEMISDNEAENFLNWLKKAKNPAKVIVEGYQIYRMNYKTKGKFYNPLIEKEKISMIIVNPNPNTIVQNRIIREKRYESSKNYRYNSFGVSCNSLLVCCTAGRRGCLYLLFGIFQKRKIQRNQRKY